MRKFQRHSCFQCRHHFTTSFDPHSGHFSFRDFTIKNNFDETVSSKLLYRYVYQLVIDISPTTFCTYTTSSVVPSAGTAGSSLGERVASSSSPSQQKKRVSISDPLKSGKRDSNSRPRPWQGRALPTELFPHFYSERTVILSNGLQK